MCADPVHLIVPTPAGDIQAGLFENGVLLPPATPMFSQLERLLSTGEQIQKPRVHKALWSAEGVATFLYHSSYLAILSDPQLPLHPECEQGRAVITNEELRRINIELSASLARLIELRNREYTTYDVLIKSSWLQMGNHQLDAQEVRSNTPGDLYALIEKAKGKAAQEGRPAHRFGTENSYRRLANYCIAWVNKNGPLHELAAGRLPPRSARIGIYRRISGEQERDLLRFIAIQIGSMMNELVYYDLGVINHLDVPGSISAGWELQAASCDVRIYG